MAPPCCFGGHSGIARIVGAAVALYGIAKIASGAMRAKAIADFKKEVAAQKKDIVYLYLMMRAPGTVNPGGPALKVETFLRAAKIPYVVRFVAPTQSPSGALPFIVHNGTVKTESTVILSYLAEAFKTDLDAKLSDADKATSQLVRWYAEDHVRWYMYRTVMVDNISVIKELFKALNILGKMAKVPGMLSMVANKMRGNVINSIDGMGMGYMSDDFYPLEFARSVKTLETQISSSKGKYLFGDKITTGDCILFAYLHSQFSFFKTLPNSNVGAKALCESTIIKKYLDSVTKELYPDFETISAVVKGPGAPEEQYL